MKTCVPFVLHQSLVNVVPMCVKYFVGVVVASLTGNQKASGSIPWRGKNLFHVSLLSLSLRIEKFKNLATMHLIE